MVTSRGGRRAIVGHGRLPPRRSETYRMHMPTLRRRWTVADLDDLPDDGNRYEVIDGELFVTQSPSLRHQDAVGCLHLLLSGYLDVEQVGHPYVSPGEIVFSPHRGVQPDVFVVPLVDGRRPESFRDVTRLLLAAEVLSRRPLEPTESRNAHCIATSACRSTGSSTSTRGRSNGRRQGTHGRRFSS